MTDEINITGASSGSPFGSAGDRANAGWMNQNRNAQEAFQRRQFLAAQKSAAQAAKATGIQARAQEATGMAHLNNWSSQQIAQQVAARSAKAAADAQGVSRFRNWSTQQIAGQAASRAAALGQTSAGMAQMRNWAAGQVAQRSAAATSYNNDYRMAGRENAAMDANSKAKYRSSTAYYSTQEMSRLGGRGASAINNGDLKELIRIDKHLSKMDTNLDKFVKSNGMTSQEREAAKKTARETLASSFNQMSAAAAGAPGIKGAIMRSIVASRSGGGSNGYGGGGGGSTGGPGGGNGKFGTAALGALGAGIEGLDMLAGPVGIAATVAAAAYELPNGISDIYNSTYNSALPYLNILRGAGKMGISGGFSSQDLIGRINPSNGKTPAWMKAYGIGPQDAMSMLSNYGIAPTSVDGAQSTIERLAGLTYQPGFAGMSDSDLQGMAKSSDLLGLDKTKNIADLQKLMTTAVTTGSDRSQVLRSILGAAQQSAAGGTMFGSTTGMSGISTRMMNSGLSGAMTGASQASFAAAMTNTGNNLGRNPISDMPMWKYLSSKGGMKATAAQAFPPGLVASLSKTDAGKRLIQDFNNSQSPYAKLQFLGQAMNGDTSFMASVYNDPAFSGSGSISSNQDLRFAAQTGNTLGNTIGYTSGGGRGGLNNPGNLMEPGSGTVLQSFTSKEKGLEAMASLLGRYQTKYGLNTVAGIVSRYAPPSANNTAAYIAYVNKRMNGYGFKSNQKLDIFNNPTQMADLMSSMISYEGTGPISPADILNSTGGGKAGSFANMGNATAGNGLGATAAQAAALAAKKSADAGGAALAALGDTPIKLSADVVNVSTLIVKSFVSVAPSSPLAHMTGRFSASPRRQN